MSPSWFRATSFSFLFWRENELGELLPRWGRTIYFLISAQKLSNILKPMLSFQHVRSHKGENRTILSEAQHLLNTLLHVGTMEIQLMRVTVLTGHANVIWFHSWSSREIYVMQECLRVEQHFSTVLIEAFCLEDSKYFYLNGKTGDCSHNTHKHKKIIEQLFHIN